MKTMHRISTGAYSFLLLFASLLRAQVASQQSNARSDAPEAAIMASVMELANYMAHVQGAVLPPVFVDEGLVIVDNFAPYVFVGKDAAPRWDAGFRQHAITAKDLKFSFGLAHDFERTGDRVFFVLPTTWQGAYKGRRFEEHGAWSFVLKNTAGQWRILAYAWGATDLQDWPLQRRK